MTDPDIDPRPTSEARAATSGQAELARLATLIDRADAEASRLRARRFELWVEARRAGLSWRDIAKASGVDHAMVAKVVAKRGEAS